MSPATQTNRTRIHRRQIGTLIACAALIAGSAVVSADPALLPPFHACQLDGHPPAADLVPLLSPFEDPGAEVRAVLMGEVSVGTNCSIYKLPV